MSAAIRFTADARHPPRCSAVSPLRAANYLAALVWWLAFLSHEIVLFWSCALFLPYHTKFRGRPSLATPLIGFGAHGARPHIHPAVGPIGTRFARPPPVATVPLAERIVVPRLDLKHLHWDHGAVEWLVVDVAHAFHNMPIRASERQFLCGKVCTQFFVFNVLGMGGKFLPNIWSQLAAAIGRVVSSVFRCDEFLCEIYEDDPSWPLEEAFLKDRKPSLSRCWPSPSWDSSKFGTWPVSVTVWFGSAPSSQLKTSSSQWPFQRTSLMPCTATRDHSCTKERSPIILRQAFVCCWCGPDAAALR